MEKSLNPEDSLKVITEMVNRTRQNLNEGSYYYLLWGWLALMAAAAEYILMEYIEVDWHPIVWGIMGIAGGIASAVYGMKDKSSRGHTSFIDRAMKMIWLAFGAMMLVTLMYGFTANSWGVVYAFIIALYGMGTFISGGILKFKPLMIGGVLSWVIAGAAFIFSDTLLNFPTMLILLMVSLVVSYLIPGYALKNSESTKNAA